MRHFNFALAILFFSFVKLFGKEIAIKPTYSHTKNFIFPFLIVETVKEITTTENLLINKVENYLLRTKLPYKGHYFDKGISIDSLTIDQFLLPLGMNSLDFAQKLQNCKKENCLLKLHNLSEKDELIKTPKSKRIETFKKLLFKRVERFLVSRELKGYDSRINNIPTLKEAFSLFSFVKSDFPLSFKFITEGFWIKASLPPTLKKSFLREGDLDIKVEDFHIPYFINEAMVFEEKKNKLYSEINVYSSSSLSFYGRSIAIKKNKEKINVILGTVLEIDELTKSSFNLIMKLKKYQQAISSWHEALLSGI